MRQLLKSISLKRFTAEVVIVVVGVLIALALDNWNDQRREHEAERAYLMRLRSDVAADTAEFHQRIRNIRLKMEGLDYAIDILSQDAEVSDTIALLDALATGARYAWANAPIRAATFEDLKSTGNLSVIRDNSLRDEIVRYYFMADYEERRLETRRTGYGDVSYTLVPRGEEFGTSKELSAVERKAAMNRVRAVNLVPVLIAERNFAQFFELMQRERLPRAEALLRRLGA